MRFLAFCLLALASTAYGRVLSEKRELSELPATISCPPGSVLFSAAIVDARYACSPAYYNCLGVPAGGVGQLSYCQDGLVFDPTYFVATSTYPNGQGGACNYNAPACGAVPTPTSPQPAGSSPQPATVAASSTSQPIVVAAGTSPQPGGGTVPATGTLPATIACPGSLLYSAEIVDPVYACSPAYYNCLGVPVGGTGYLSLCQTGLVFDKNNDVTTETYPNGQGGSCNYSTAACAASG